MKLNLSEIKSSPEYEELHNKSLIKKFIIYACSTLEINWKYIQEMLRFIKKKKKRIKKYKNMID